MYRIMNSEGQMLGRTDDIVYIKRGPSGDFTSATETDAEGISFQGTPYNLSGFNIVEGEPVSVFREDAGAVFAPNDEFQALVTGLLAAYGMTPSEYQTSISQLDERLQAQETFINAAIGGATE